MQNRLNFALLMAALFVAGCKTTSSTDPTGYSHFIGLTNFSDFQVSHDASGETVILSPAINSTIKWNQLVVSWNTTAPAGSYLKVEARALEAGHDTKFFVMGLWSPDDKAFPRASVSHQKDADGDVRADTLTLTGMADAVQIRLTLGGSNDVLPKLKFVGLSFCNTTIKPQPLPPNRAAWGKIIPTPERSQQSYPGGNGWCSPTSVSMVLSRWAKVANRPDWDFDAPEVAAGVFDHEFKLATGNWPFNTAFAGKLDGMRACVSRFSDISELEDWIAAGIPVVISARWDLLQDGRPDDFNGHLTVCRGFTEDGDLVINDPWTDVKVESVRHVYKRANVMRAWATSHNTVYLIYPENTRLPVDRFGHW